MMERLTIDEVIEHCKRTTAKYENLNGINKLETADISFVPVKEYWEHRQVKEYLEELKRYRDLEKQGLLVRLPVKVGDTVYEVQKLRKRIQPYTIISIHISRCGVLIGWVIEGDEGIYSNTNGFCDYAIGKTVFLTKEEAEQKLKEMEESK